MNHCETCTCDTGDNSYIYRLSAGTLGKRGEQHIKKLSTDIIKPEKGLQSFDLLYRLNDLRLEVKTVRMRNSKWQAGTYGLGEATKGQIVGVKPQEFDVLIVITIWLNNINYYLIPATHFIDGQFPVKTCASYGKKYSSDLTFMVYSKSLELFEPYRFTQQNLVEKLDEFPKNFPKNYGDFLKEGTPFLQQGIAS